MTSEHILIQLAVKADIELGASELKFQHSNHSAKVPPGRLLEKWRYTSDCCTIDGKNHSILRIFISEFLKKTCRVRFSQNICIISFLGALKQYLRQLPEPLMTSHLYNEWINASA